MLVGGAKKERHKKGTFVGTAMYLPPEMLSADNQSGLYTDLWALGVIIFELCSGGKKMFSTGRDSDVKELNRIYEKIMDYEFEFPP